MRQRCADALTLRETRGQALLEAPMTVLTACVLALVIVQLGVWFHGYLMVSTISADLCRAVAVDDTIDGWLLTSYANDRMQALDGGPAYRIPGSLTVECSGDKRSQIAVTVTIAQRPLPLIRTISAGLVPAAVSITATSHARGAYHEVAGEPADAPDRFGAVTR